MKLEEVDFGELTLDEVEQFYNDLKQLITNYNVDPAYSAYMVDMQKFKIVQDIRNILKKYKEIYANVSEGSNVVKVHIWKPLPERTVILNFEVNNER